MVEDGQEKLDGHSTANSGTLVGDSDVLFEQLLRKAEESLARTCNAEESQYFVPYSYANERLMSPIISRPKSISTKDPTTSDREHLSVKTVGDIKPLSAPKSRSQKKKVKSFSLFVVYNNPFLFFGLSQSMNSPLSSIYSPGQKISCY